MCDMIFAGHHARFALPEIQVGLVPGMGGLSRLARIIGKHRAMEFVLTGKTIDAEQANTDGIVNSVFPANDVVRETLKIGNEISRHSTEVLRGIKEIAAAEFDMSRYRMEKDWKVFRKLWRSRWNREV